MNLAFLLLVPTCHFKGQHYFVSQANFTNLFTLYFNHFSTTVCAFVLAAVRQQGKVCGLPCESSNDTFPFSPSTAVLHCTLWWGQAVLHAFPSQVPPSSPKASSLGTECLHIPQPREREGMGSSPHFHAVKYITTYKRFDTHDNFVKQTNV